MSQAESDIGTAGKGDVERDGAPQLRVMPETSAAEPDVPAANPRRATLRALDEMIAALDHEIGAASRQPRQRPIACLTSGRRLPASGQTFRYELAEPLRGLAHGDQAEIAGESEVYTCTVAAVTSTTLDLTVADHVGDVGPAGKLITDATWINERVRDVLVRLREEVRAGIHELDNVRLALATVGLSGYRFGRGDVDPDILLDLTEQQREAVRVAVGSELSYVIGPAGCGKSRVLSYICEALVRRGERVLLLAPSNRAVDVALNKVAERLGSEVNTADGFPVLRVGSGVTSHLRASVRARTGLEHILDRLVGDGSADRAWTGLIDQRRAQFRQALIGSCKLAAATLHYACLSGMLRETPWDVVVIDEGSMAIPPIIFLAARLARRRVVVLGDHNQLPPVVYSQDPVARQWLVRDVFDLASIPEAIERDDLLANTTVLTEQFRMAKPIARLHDAVFCGNRLNTDTAPDLQEPPLGCGSLLYVNSGRLIPRSRTEQVDGSRRNLGHAAIVAALTRRVARRAPEVRTLILTPFRSQAQALREAVGGIPSVEVGTIHSCQGSEASIVILDLTEGFGCRQTSFLTGDEPGWMGNRLLNTAVSRAEHHLILVADFDFFEEGGNRAGMPLWNLLNWFRAHALQIDPGSLLRSRAA